MADDARRDLIEHIEEHLEDKVLATELCTYKNNPDSEGVIIVRKDAIYDTMLFLRDDPECDFEMLVDLTATDQPSRGEERFDIVYNLLSLSQNHRIRVKVPAADGDIISSIIEIYSTAGWFEREVWDMFGIPFSGNPDLRRILTDYGFEGHPLRKEFPLTGYVEVRYDEELKRVIYEPVKLTQDFRVFENLSPWEGMTDIMKLPGDEKAVQPKVIGKKIVED
mgnify:CR=1 FL=1